jgi:hypothetical protein
MAQNSYPTLAELQARLTEAGITTVSDTTAQANLDAAISWWESNTYAPFLNTGTTPTTFNAEWLQDGTVLFRRGVLSSQPVTLTYSGTLWTVTTDYTLRRERASDSSGPYTWARRTTPMQFMLPDYDYFVSVSGVIGYGATIPDEVWEGILDMALFRVMPVGFLASGFSVFRRIAIGNQDQDVTFCD